MAKPVLGAEAAAASAAAAARRRAGGSASCSGRSAPGSPTTSCCWPTRWSPTRSTRSSPRSTWRRPCCCSATPGTGRPPATRRRRRRPPATPATKAELGGLVDHLVRELDAVDFFRAEERRASLIRTITVMIERPPVELVRGPADARDHQGSGRRSQGAAERLDQRLRTATVEAHAVAAAPALSGGARRGPDRLRPARRQPHAGGGGAGVRGADGAGAAGQGAGVPVAGPRAGGDQPDREAHRLCRPPAVGDGGGRARHGPAGRQRRQRRQLSLPDRARPARRCSST